jgi:cysteine desulfurase
MTEPPRPIYLDHNASTPVLPEVRDAMLPYLGEHFGNPSSNHRYGRIMREAVERAREQVASLIDCSAPEIYFTAGGTEANNLAVRGLAAANPGRRQVITSVIEHPATVEPCNVLKQEGYRVDTLPVNGTGRLEPDDLARIAGADTLLVTVVHANSETGTTQPVRQLSRIAHEAGALIHCDAAQSAGKIPVSVRRDGLDLLSVAGHKLYAPQGVGALYARSGIRLSPLVAGAGHEKGLRPGTENVASIVGLGEACAIAAGDLETEGRRLLQLRERLWRRLQDGIPGMALNGHPEYRLPNTLNARFPGVSGNRLLDECKEIAASTGSACHESGESASAVILAMGIAPESATGSVRLTLGRLSNESDTDQAADALIRAWNALVEKGSHDGRANRRFP